jgi:hypothetical protein
MSARSGEIYSKTQAVYGRHVRDGMLVENGVHIHHRPSRQGWNVLLLTVARVESPAKPSRTVPVATGSPAKPSGMVPVATESPAKPSRTVPVATGSPAEPSGTVPVATGSPAEPSGTVPVATESTPEPSGTVAALGIKN